MNYFKMCKKEFIEENFYEGIFDYEFLNSFETLESIKSYDFTEYLHPLIFEPTEQLLQLCKEKRYERIEWTCPIIDSVIEGILEENEFEAIEDYELLSEENKDIIGVLEMIRDINRQLRDYMMILRYEK